VLPLRETGDLRLHSPRLHFPTHSDG
jgi:hypothetical protein